MCFNCSETNDIKYGKEKGFCKKCYIKKCKENLLIVCLCLLIVFIVLLLTYTKETWRCFY